MRHALLCLFLLSACEACAPSQVRPRFATAARASAVRILVSCVVNDEFKMYAGSGVAITSRHVLTAKHVVDCPSPLITVTPPNGKPRLAVVDDVDPDGDAARLYILGDAPLRAVGVPYATLDRLDVPVCAATAYPRRDYRCGRTQEFYHGEIDGENVDGYVRTDLVATFGNSGAGVYDANGNLVGLLIAATMTSTGQVDGMVIETRIHRLLNP